MDTFEILLEHFFSPSICPVQTSNTDTLVLLQVAVLLGQLLVDWALGRPGSRQAIESIQSISGKNQYPGIETSIYPLIFREDWKRDMKWRSV